MKTIEFLLPVMLILPGTILCQQGREMSDNETISYRSEDSYPVQKIGDRIWMSENIKLTHNRDGESVKYSYPDNNPENSMLYGLLYDHETALKICPEGWRLPSDEDWERLFDITGWSNKVHLKDSASLEKSSLSCSDLNSNFMARAAGYGNNEEYDNLFGSHAVFWSSTQTGLEEGLAMSYILSFTRDSISHAPQHRNYAFSVRCVKNAGEVPDDKLPDIP